MPVFVQPKHILFFFHFIFPVCNVALLTKLSSHQGAQFFRFNYHSSNGKALLLRMAPSIWLPFWRNSPLVCPPGRASDAVDAGFAHLLKSSLGFPRMCHCSKALCLTIYLSSILHLACLPGMATPFALIKSLSVPSPILLSPHNNRAIQSLTYSLSPSFSLALFTESFVFSFKQSYHSGTKVCLKTDSTQHKIVLFNVPLENKAEI